MEIDRTTQRPWAYVHPGSSCPRRLLLLAHPLHAGVPQGSDLCPLLISPLCSLGDWLHPLPQPQLHQLSKVHQHSAQTLLSKQTCRSNSFLYRTTCTTWRHLKLNSACSFPISTSTLLCIAIWRKRAVQLYLIVCYFLCIKEERTNKQTNK